jgi:hypothetical protein
MRTRIRKLFATSLVGGLLLALIAPIGAAQAETAKPGVGGYAWYWEEQRQAAVQDPDGTDLARYELPNPFCPAPPGNVGAPEATCKSGRLPVEVRGGDYKSPNMISALAFDLTVAPIGSKVTKFTVTLKEASDEQSKPVNVEGKKVQACPVKEFFGDGEARQYKEAPKYSCAKSDPVGTRKKVKGKKGSEETFEWNFDLTPLAQKWVAKGAPVTAVMLTPVEPKKSGASDNQWRVVYTGSANPKEKGVKTTLVYEPAEFEDPLDNLDFGPTTSPGGGSTGGFGSTGGSGFSGGGSGAGSLPAGNAPAAGGDSKTSSTQPATNTKDAAKAAAELEQPPAPIGVPWYMWLAIIGGIVAFTFVRNFVLETATGIRPNGVLAQIQRINAERRGTALTQAAETSPVAAGLAGLTATARKLGGGARSLMGKLFRGGKA